MPRSLMALSLPLILPSGADDQFHRDLAAASTCPNDGAPCFAVSPLQLQRQQWLGHDHRQQHARCRRHVQPCVWRRLPAGRWRRRWRRWLGWRRWRGRWFSLRHYCAPLRNAECCRGGWRRWRRWFSRYHGGEHQLWCHAARRRWWRRRVRWQRPRWRFRRRGWRRVYGSDIGWDHNGCGPWQRRWFILPILLSRRRRWRGRGSGWLSYD